MATAYRGHSVLLETPLYAAGFSASPHSFASALERNPIAIFDALYTVCGFSHAASAMGAPLDGDDISEVAMNDDVTVVEDFTDVSDDELARLVADLRRELGDE